MESVTKNIIIILSLFTLVFAAYYFFTQRDAYLNFEPDGQTLAQLQSRAQTFIFRRQILDQITLDTNLLSDSRLSQLRTYTTPVQPFSVGRPNPFLPVESRSLVPISETASGAQ